MFSKSNHRQDVMYQRHYMQDVELHDNEWYVDLRMTYRTYEKLCSILKPYIKHRDTNYREALLVHKVVALVLRKLAFGQSNRTIGNKFGVGREIVLKYTRLVSKALVDK